MLARQLSLLGAPAAREIRFDPSFGAARRRDLGHGAWVEHAPGWLAGADLLFDRVRDGADWRSERRVMYEREVDVPRLLARLGLSEGEPLPHPMLAELSAALSARYGRTLDRLTFAYYRDGRDSVAWHGDRIGRVRRETVVAIVSLGEPRRLMFRPRGGGSSLSYTLGGGDLLVMGGTCQTTWEHAVPKVADAGPRIAVMFREAPPSGEAD